MATGLRIYMAGPSKSQWCGILQNNCWDALHDEIIEHFFCLCTTGLEHPQLDWKEPLRKHFLCQSSSELRNPVELCLTLAHSSHDKQCGVESSASLGVRSPSLTFSTPTCNDYRLFYRPSSSSKPLFILYSPYLSSTPFFSFSTDPLHLQHPSQNMKSKVWLRTQIV